MRKEEFFARSVKDKRFPVSLFIVVYVVLILMSGIHTGMILWMFETGTSAAVAVGISVIYWNVIACGLVFYFKEKIRRVYEEPMHHLADATKRVADGDFSVYVPPLHTSDKLDYLDIMLEDFNKMVEELGSIETLKTDFFSNVSHEIKTPLAIIQNHAELLLREPLSEKQKGSAEAIFRASKRLADLIGNILKLNKLEKQNILPEKESFDLCTQLAECALNYEQMWEKKELEFEAEMEEEVFITADRALLELVWNNLFSNAVKYTEAGGSIQLKEWSDETDIYVSVSDTGCGMGEDTKRRIFEKFYQGDTSHAMVGNGLGLALAKRVLDLSGFAIEVESEVGKGSTFTVGIPKD